MTTCIQWQNGIAGFRKGGHVQVILKNLNIELKAGEVTVLLGRNGAGKSTLMRTLAGVQPMLGGSIELMGQSLSQMRPRTISKHLAWVTPLRELMPGLNGWDIVALGRQPHTSWHGRLSSLDYQAIEAALKTCGAIDFALRPMNELSDGERQRLLLARALAQETPVILLDEPTAFLDRPGRNLVFKLAQDWAQNQGRCLLISTHDLDLAMKFGNQAILVHEGQAIQAPCENAAMNVAIEKAFAL